MLAGRIEARTGARRNPRGHHDHAGDCYWITSSAVANSVSGMVRPSALAVFMLMTNSNLASLRTGWIGAAELPST